MDILSFVLFYFGNTAALVFVLLFGEAPAFQRTPVAKAHWLLTRGWVEGVEWAAERCVADHGGLGLVALAGTVQMVCSITC